jgi:hypothetical protein
LKLVTRLSEDFAHRGLHFFKVNKTVLHVAVARPRYLDLESNPVGEGIQRILNAIDRIPGCTRRKLLEHLGIQLQPTQDAPAAEVPPSQELQSIVTDLHRLIHEGHVIEFANGHLETAKKPAPRPVPRPQPASKPAPAGPAPEATPATGDVAASAEGGTAVPTAGEAPEPPPAEAEPSGVAVDPVAEPEPMPAVEAEAASAPAEPSFADSSVPPPEGAASVPEPTVLPSEEEVRINPS